MVTLIISDGEGWTSTEIFSSEEWCIEYIKENYDPELCRKMRYNPSPIMISGPDHKVTRFDGYSYC